MEDGPHRAGDSQFGVLSHARVGCLLLRPRLGEEVTDEALIFPLWYVGALLFDITQGTPALRIFDIHRSAMGQECLHNGELAVADRIHHCGLA